MSPHASFGRKKLKSTTNQHPHVEIQELPQHSNSTTITPTLLKLNF